MTRTSLAVPLTIVVCALAISGCAPAEAPSVPPTPSAAAVSATPGMQAWPTAFDVELHGTYAADPPFRIPFTITVDATGWYSGHLHAAFIDLQRFDGMTPHQFPNRMLGFADPDHVRGGTDVDVENLAPDGALDLLAARASLQVSNRAPQRLLGIDGVRMDLHSATDSNPLFGNGADNFGLGPELDVRLVALPLRRRLFAVVVLAAPGDLEAAWEQAIPMLASLNLE
jgi:hypothetical protein